jgi:hypothetical protein
LPGQERLARSFRGAFFNALWLLVVPKALLNLAVRQGPIRYSKMEHSGSTPPDPIPQPDPVTCK